MHAVDADPDEARFDAIGDAGGSRRIFDRAQAFSFVRPDFYFAIVRAGGDEPVVFVLQDAGGEKGERWLGKVENEGSRVNATI